MISQDTKSAFHSVSPSPPPPTTSTNSNSSSQQLTTKMTNFSIAAIMHTKLIQQQQQSEQQLQVVRAASAAAAAAAALHQAAAMKQPVSPSTADQFSHHGIPELKRQRISGSSPKIQSGKTQESLSVDKHFFVTIKKILKRL